MIGLSEIGQVRRGWQGLREWWHKGIRSAAEVGPALEAVVASMLGAGYPVKDIFAVRLALEEALVNAIKHGHRGDTSKVVRLHCWGSAEEVVATVVDQGEGFNLDEVPDPLAEENQERSSGRGLLLMRTYATSLSFNARGNGLVFRRRRSTG